MAAERYIGRANVAKRIAPLDGSPGRSIYGGGSVRFELVDGARLVASKVGSRFVKGRHRKGGRSSNRFRRRREEQERDLVDEAAAEAARVLAPWRNRVERVAL